MIKPTRAISANLSFKVKVVIAILSGILILIVLSIVQTNKLTTANSQQIELPQQVYEVAPNEVEALSLPSWSHNYSISDKGELMIQIPPCTTPTPPADYRELLLPGIVQCNDHACIQGFAIEGHPSPTPFPGQPNFIDPAAVTIVYQSSGSCP